MAEDETGTEEKGSQQVHPDKPARDDGAAPDDPNEAPPGSPQHEPRDPDEQISTKWSRGASNP